MKKSYSLIANGELKSKSLKPQILKNDHLVAIDGGLFHCRALELTPDLIVGDFDSASQELLATYPDIPRISLPRDKDQTDLEVALEEVFPKASRIDLFAAWGHRIDHSLTNALLLSRYPDHTRILTDTETLFVCQGTTHIACHPGQTLSLIPLYGQARGIHTKGLKWELKDGTLDQSFIGISNLCLTHEVTVWVDSGLLLCCLNF